MGEIAHPPQQPPGHARRPARPAGYLARSTAIDRDAELARAARHHPLQLGDGIEIEPHRDPEAVAQRGGQQALAGGRADQRERRQVDPHAARRRPLADDQVERAVLHRRVEHFLDHRIEPVDLVDEQHVVRLEVGQERGEVAGPADHRAAGGAKADPHLARDDLRQRGLAEPRRAEEQHMVHRLAAVARGLDEHPQVLPRRLLADELAERLRPQRGVRVLGLARVRKHG